MLIANNAEVLGESRRDGPSLVRDLLVEKRATG
jgi:hypothetical protein